MLRAEEEQDAAEEAAMSVQPRQNQWHQRSRTTSHKHKEHKKKTTAASPELKGPTTDGPLDVAVEEAEEEAGASDWHHRSERSGGGC